MSDSFILTIDGPAGAGKTTIAKKVAEKINYRYVDTGAMYRAVTLKVIKEGISFSDILSIEDICEKTDIDIAFGGMAMKILIDSKDVTDLIRNSDVSENTSLIAAIPAVRYKLAKIQRGIAKNLKKAVFEGRDMGSIVFPDADLKIYLDAGIEERARRRWEDLKLTGEEIDIEVLKEKIRKRDERDESRGLAPLRIPDNSHIIDSTSMAIDDVVKKIVALFPD